MLTITAYWLLSILLSILLSCYCLLIKLIAFHSESAGRRNSRQNEPKLNNKKRENWRLIRKCFLVNLCYCKRKHFLNLLILVDLTWALLSFTLRSDELN